MYFSRLPYIGLVVAAMLTFSAGMSFSATAAESTKRLKGKIITSPNSIEIPEHDIVKKLTGLDRDVFTRERENGWAVYLVAFFNQPLPVHSLGIVVLDNKNEAVTVARVGGFKGQTTLACSILVDSTETPGKEHKLQIYYAKDGSPVVLAEKTITLK